MAYGLAWRFHGKLWQEKLAGRGHPLRAAKWFHLGARFSSKRVLFAPYSHILSLDEFSAF